MAEKKKTASEQTDNIILEDEKYKLLDHEYDGIQELDNKLPPWWLYGFYFTIVVAVGYLIYYDVTGWGPSQIDEYEQQLELAEARFNRSGPGEPETPVDYTTLAAFTDEANLMAGKSIFEGTRQLCATCHGMNGEGLVGPDVTNSYWVNGCDLASLMTSVKTGYPAKGMPAYGSGLRMSNLEIQQVSSYLLSIRGSNPSGAKAPDLTRELECN